MTVYIVRWTDKAYHDHVSDEYRDYRDAREVALHLRRCSFTGVTINGDCEF